MGEMHDLYGTDDDGERNPFDNDPDPIDTSPTGALAKVREKVSRGKRLNKEETRRWQNAAHGKVAQAVQSKVLVQRPCERCGSKRNIEGHHQSYAEDDWLKVVWLCHRCHYTWHDGRRRSFKRFLSDRNS